MCIQVIRDLEREPEGKILPRFNRVRNRTRFSVAESSVAGDGVRWRLG